MNFINVLKQSDTTDYTLIIPSVSVGNIGQLTADVLISTFNFRKIGRVWDPAIIPSVGGDPFTADTTEICTACELYGSDALKLAVLQLRSSIEYKLLRTFLTKLCESIIDLKFRQVIILTSCFDYEKRTVETASFRYISNLDNRLLQFYENLSITPMTSDMNGAGFAFKLHEVLANANIQSTIIVKYCSEGDNRPDAVQMLNLLCKILSIPECETPIFPRSWEFVFGNPPPVGMY